MTFFETSYVSVTSSVAFPAPARAGNRYDDGGFMAKRRESWRTAKHGDIERTAALLDVQLLDLLAQMEALLRTGREIQREALRIRGVPQASTDAQRTAAAAKIETITRGMTDNHRTIGTLIGELRKYAQRLHLSVRKGSDGAYRPSDVGEQRRTS
jgi:hypothetical protein